MISLERSGLVGRGFHRSCYRHPEDSRLCIKVLDGDHQKEADREIAYYRHLQRKGATWEMLARYHGSIETNLGLGQVFDLITDPNGETAKTLEYYIKLQEPSGNLSSDGPASGNLDSSDKDKLILSLQKLKRYLLDNKIITTEIKPRNIVCQRLADHEFRSVIVDDIGNTEFIPFSSYIGYLGKAKIERKWERFERLLRKNGFLKSTCE